MEVIEECFAWKIVLENYFCLGQSFEDTFWIMEKRDTCRFSTHQEEYFENMCAKVEIRTFCLSWFYQSPSSF